MTVTRWIAPVLGLLCSCLVTQVAHAQTAQVTGSSYTQSDPAEFFGNGSGFAPVSHSAIDTAATQDWMQPWPSISPFENRFSEHYIDNGLWRLLQGNEQRDHYFSAEFLRAKFKRPDRKIIGDPDAPHNIPLPFNKVSMDVFSRGEVPTGGVLEGQVGQKKEDNFHPGMKFTLGYWDPDNSGAEWNAFWISDAHARYSRGTGDTRSPSITHGLPLRTNQGGYTVRYDSLFAVEFESEMAGTDYNFISRPMFSTGSFKLRPLWGLRYNYMRETFKFNGLDSGRLVRFADNGSATSVNRRLFPPYDAALISEIQSHIAGPQWGFQYQLGGDKFRIHGTHKFGLMANSEKITLEGGGFGDGRVNGLNYARRLDNASEFSHEQNHSHVSPLVEHNIYAEMKVLHIVPVLKSMKVFNNAKLRFGYSITAIWEVTRPGDVIDWRGAPLTPNIVIDRTSTYTSNWNVGLIWD